MKTLREQVIVTTATGKLQGHLFVGADGLPKLVVEYPGDALCTYTGPLQHYTPATLPAAWDVFWQDGNATDVLVDTWARIQVWRQEIADAQREQECHPYLDGPAEPVASAMLREAETPQERCDIEQFKADADAHEESDEDPRSVHA